MVCFWRKCSHAEFDPPVIVIDGVGKTMHPHLVHLLKCIVLSFHGFNANAPEIPGIHMGGDGTDDYHDRQINSGDEAMLHSFK